MSNDEILDIAHVSFLGVIGALIGQSGAAATKGTLMRIAMKTAEEAEAVDFPTFEAFAQAAERGGTPIAKVEGPSRVNGGGVFGLPACPFAGSIESYGQVFKAVPEGFSEMTDEYNRPSRATDQLRVGYGAGVSPFCSVHQPLRSALGNRITIGGKPIRIYQLGCKSSSGKKGIAAKWIEEAGVSPDVVDRMLDDNMCCYAVQVED